MDSAKRTVTPTAASGDELAARMGAALAGWRTEPRIAFESVDLLHRVCAPPDRPASGDLDPCVKEGR